MTKIGIGLPSLSVAETSSSAQLVVGYDFDSFSIYGDLGDLPPYAALHATANILKGSAIKHVGPMGVPAGMQHPEVIAMHACALEEQMPGQSYVGLVRGAFLESIGEKPATLARLETTINTIRKKDSNIPIYLGGFGERLLILAGQLGVNGIKLGGTTNIELAKQARETIANPELEIVLGAVSVIDPDRKAARALARHEVAKYLDVVGSLDNTLTSDELDSLNRFVTLFRSGSSEAPEAISDSLLDKFALAGTPEDADTVINKMDGAVDRFELGTPHGIGSRANAICFIGESLVGKRL